MWYHLVFSDGKNTYNVRTTMELAKYVTKYYSKHHNADVISSQVVPVVVLQNGNKVKLPVNEFVIHDLKFVVSQHDYENNLVMLDNPSHELDGKTRVTWTRAWDYNIVVPSAVYEEVLKVLLRENEVDSRKEIAALIRKLSNTPGDIGFQYNLAIVAEA